MRARPRSHVGLGVPGQPGDRREGHHGQHVQPGLRSRRPRLLDSFIASKTMSNAGHLRPAVRQAGGQQDPHAARPRLVRRLGVPGAAEDAQGPDRGGARAALGRTRARPSPAQSVAAPGGCPRTARNLAAAVRFATWVSRTTPTRRTWFPVTPPTRRRRRAGRKQQASGYWAYNISTPITAAASQVWTGWTPPEFSQESVWASTVSAGMAQGKSIESLLPAWQTAITNQAKVLGYTVMQSPGQDQVGPALASALAPGSRAALAPGGWRGAPVRVRLRGAAGPVRRDPGHLLAVPGPDQAHRRVRLVGNFIQTAEDYRFVPAIEHVAAFLVLWLVSLTVFLVLLALVVHRLAARRGKAFIRFAYYIPGALAGASSVLLWLFVLEPLGQPGLGPGPGVRRQPVHQRDRARPPAASCSPSSRSGPARAAGS